MSTYWLIGIIFYGVVQSQAFNCPFTLPKALATPMIRALEMHVRYLVRFLMSQTTPPSLQARHASQFAAFKT